MFALLRGRNAAVFSVLVLLMAATRFHHLGSAMHLPDASLAVFFLGGIFLPAMGFAALIVEAVAIDAIALSMGTSGFCVTWSYTALLAAYGALWWLGGRVARLEGINLRNSVLALAAWFAGASIAFLISNGSFYWFSGRYPEPHWAEYVHRVGLYYLPYVTRALPYVVTAGALYALWQWRQRPQAHTA